MIAENHEDIAALKAFFRDICELSAAKSQKLAESLVADRNLYSVKKLEKAFSRGLRIETGGSIDQDDDCGGLGGGSSVTSIFTNMSLVGKASTAAPAKTNFLSYSQLGHQ